MYKYIVIDKIAATDLVSSRQFQSIDFAAGRKFVELLTGKTNILPTAPGMHCFAEKEYLYVLNNKSIENNILVIDYENAPLFEGRSDNESLYLIQKIMRFSIKRWENMSFTLTERFLSGSTKAILFPFPFSAQVPFRITCELSPDDKRRSRRTSGAQELLIYKCGNDEGGGAGEQASITNFRKAISDLREFQSTALEHANRNESTRDIASALDVTTLSDGSHYFQLGDASIEDWLPLLTDIQKEFITKNIEGPHRIDGPAGTGKTLCLVLKCIYHLIHSLKNNLSHHSLFIVHSEATKKNIEHLFKSDIFKYNISSNCFDSSVSLRIETLQSYCSTILNTNIQDTEFLDRDAFESKLIQILYITEALNETKAKDFSTYNKLMSPEFISVISNTDDWYAAEMFQHEISVMIKGRAEEDQTKYFKLSRLEYGLPVITTGDRAFTFQVFNSYRNKFIQSGQFDTDDVVLSALGQLSTPIWRRRRLREGFDSIYIDETHLFNFNELSIFHKLTKNEDHYPIIYSSDISQSLGDKGWSNGVLNDAICSTCDEKTRDKTSIDTVFRSSPHIINLAFSVTSSGATLFNNFHNPLNSIKNAFSFVDEKKCDTPTYKFFISDSEMIKEAFLEADRVATATKSLKSDVAIISFGDELFNLIQKYSISNNKPVEIINKRGDVEALKLAKLGGKYIITQPEYVGGLEFSSVIILGVDKDRVPPSTSSDCNESCHFLSYVAHQKLYVAITRAKYHVSIFGIKSRGPSPIFNTAISNNLIKLIF